MFETVKPMFSQDPAFWREASGNRFYDDFELDVGGILEAFWKPSWLSYFLLVALVTKIADMVDTFSKHAKMTRLASTRGGRGW